MKGWIYTVKDDLLWLYWYTHTCWSLINQGTKVGQLFPSFIWKLWQRLNRTCLESPAFIQHWLLYHFKVEKICLIAISLWLMILCDSKLLFGCWCRGSGWSKGLTSIFYVHNHLEGTYTRENFLHDGLKGSTMIQRWSDWVT